MNLFIFSSKIRNIASLASLETSRGTRDLLYQTKATLLACRETSVPDNVCQGETHPRTSTGHVFKNLLLYDKA